MKKQILIGLILLSSVVKMNAQTNADLLDGQHGSFYGEFNSLTLSNNIDYNAVNYNRNSNLIIQPIHLPNYTGQTNAPFQDYGMIATIGGLSMFPTQLAFSNGGKIAYRTNYKYADSYTFDNVWRNIVTVGAGSAQNHLTKFGSNNDLANSIIYDDDTNVGIGTNDPKAKLDVAGSAKVTNEFTILGSGADIGGTLNIFNTAKTTNGQASRWSIYNMSGSYGNSLQFWAYDNLGCANGGMCAPKLALMDDGRVGIGTTTPNGNLEVANSSGGTLTISTNRINGTSSSPLFPKLDFLGYANSNKARITTTEESYNTNGSKFSILVNNGDSPTSLVERFTILQSGKVGIGISNITTDALLTVNGTIHAKEVKVSLDGLADYVFHPTYKLMPLPEVEQYIKTNSHLPEIPSASEVSKNGMSMGEMQNKLLQKVEELTLYAIEQEKDKKELEKKYTALLEKVEILTKQIGNKQTTNR
jgi:hypothetical protein